MSGDEEGVQLKQDNKDRVVEIVEKIIPENYYVGFSQGTKKKLSGNKYIENINQKRKETQEKAAAAAKEEKGTNHRNWLGFLNKVKPLGNNNMTQEDKQHRINDLLQELTKLGYDFKTNSNSSNIGGKKRKTRKNRKNTAGSGYSNPRDPRSRYSILKDPRFSFDPLDHFQDFYYTRGMSPKQKDEHRRLRAAFLEAPNQMDRALKEERKIFGQKKYSTPGQLENRTLPNSQFVEEAKKDSFAKSYSQIQNPLEPIKNPKFFNHLSNEDQKFLNERLTTNTSKMTEEKVNAAKETIIRDRMNAAVAAVKEQEFADKEEELYNSLGGKKRKTKKNKKKNQKRKTSKRKQKQK